jgi:nucleotide-binding universal stress UspA family protein
MQNLHHILCPVDFSPASYDAIEKASFLAQMLQADLTLLHVINVLPQTFGVLNESDSQSQNLVQEVTERTRELLRETKQRYIPYAVRSKSIIRSGRVSEEVVKAARQLNSDLMILPSRGSTFEPLVSTILRDAHCPVLAYQRLPQEAGQSEQSKGFRRVLVALDEEGSLSGLEDFMMRYLSLMGPEVYLLAVGQPGESPRKLEALRRRMETEGQRLIEQGAGPIHYRIMMSHSPASQIQEVARATRCDLIMMHSTSADPTRARELSPATHEVLRQIDLPVLAQRRVPQ